MTLRDPGSIPDAAPVTDLTKISGKAFRAFVD
jgi:hypothetical protein